MRMEDIYKHWLVFKKKMCHKLIQMLIFCKFINLLPLGKLKPKKYYILSTNTGYIVIKTLYNSDIIEYKGVRLCYDAIMLMATYSNKAIGDVILDSINNYYGR